MPRVAWRVRWSCSAAITRETIQMKIYIYIYFLAWVWDFVLAARVPFHFSLLFFVCFFFHPYFSLCTSTIDYKFRFVYLNSLRISWFAFNAFDPDISLPRAHTVPHVCAREYLHFERKFIKRLTICCRSPKTFDCFSVAARVAIEWSKIGRRNLFVGQKCEIPNFDESLSLSLSLSHS